MKRLFSYFAAFATMFAIASCQEEIAQPDMPVDGDSKTVTFSVEAPTLPQTKAFGDGTQDLKLLCAVYVGAGNTIGTPEGTFLGGKFEADDDFLLEDGVAPQIVRGKTDDDKVKWDVTITLVKNFKYDIVFWAQTVPAKGPSPYTFVPEYAQIFATYAGDANDESRDAFYKLCAGYNVMTPGDSKISLERPFAQINLGAADYDALTHLGITDLTSAISSAEATATVPNTLNLLDGSVDGAEVVSFLKTTAPVSDETGKKNTIVIGTGADAKTFRLVGMNYILADVKTANPTVDLTMNFNYNGVDLDIDVPSVPYARNYKTNIVGNLFTDDAEFEVVIAPMFEKEDEIYNTDLTLAEAFEVDRDVTLVLKEDQVISEPLILENGKTLTLNLDEYSITTETDLWDAANKVWSMISVRNGSTLVINSKGGKVVAKANDAYAIDVQDGSTVTINGGEFVGNISAVYVLDGTANINGGSYSIQQLSEPANGSDERFTLNCEDAAYKAGEAVINVTGGSFVNFNPSNNLAEGQGTNFLADGYKVNIENKDGKKYYTVVELNEIEKAISAGEPSVTLTEDLNLEGTITVPAGRQFTIDLEGNDLTSTASPAVLANGEVTIKNGNVSVGGEFVRVGDAAKVTLEGVKATSGTAESKGDNCLFIPKESKNAVVTVDAASELTTYGAAVIQSNGMTEGLVLNVNGKVTSEGDVAIYLPQVAECTVGATADISGVTGIEIRAGKLTVEDGAKVSATVNTLTAQKNGNGSTVIGAAIAVSPHTTNLPIDVTINGGEFGCAYSLYEKKLQDEDRTAKTTLAVTGGTFNAPIYSENCKDFITGGTFAEGVEDSFLADGYTVEMEEKDGKKYYTVVEEKFTAGKYWIVSDAKYAMSLTSNYGYLDVSDGGYKDNVFTFTAVEGGYTIQQADDKYLYMKDDHNTFQVSTNPTEGHVWTVTKNADGSTYKITNVLKEKTIQYASQYNSYGSYLDERGKYPMLVDASAATERPVLKVSPASKTVAADVKEFSFDITSNVAWTVTAGKGVTLDNDNTSGNGNAIVKMTFEANTTTEAVEYTATVSADGFDDIVVTVTQSGVPSGKVVTFDVDNYSFANQTALTKYEITPITFEFANGGGNNSPKYFTNGTAVRCYPKNTITVTGDNVTIKKIEVVAPEGYNNAIDLYSGGVKLDNFIWAGSSMESVVLTFDPSKSSGQSRFVQIIVTYE